GAPLTAWPSAGKWRPPGDPSWPIDPHETYRPKWPVPKRILFLLEQIEGAGASHAAALARLAEALFLDRYHAMMADAAREYRADGTTRRIPYPYQDRDAERVLRSILKENAGDPIADQVQYTIG